MGVSIMNVVYFLLPLTISLGLLFVAWFIWAVKKGQFDDLTTPAYRILLDDSVQKHSEDNKDL